MPEVLDKDTIKALSTETRQEIMKMLAKRPHTASEISKITKKHVTTVTEHLDVLEKNGLVRKRESTNKWVYYELTDKGEHLFKPGFYTFVVVLSVSLVLMFVGVLRIFNFQSFSRVTQSAGQQISAPMAEKAQDIGQQIANNTYQAASVITAADYVGWGLIVLGIAGVLYLIYRKYRK